MRRNSFQAPWMGVWLPLVLSFVLIMPPVSGWAQADRTVILSTTTSTQDSGLLDVLVPLFEKKTGYTVKTISVGTGQALALAARGEADVCLVHAPDAEKKYVSEGLLLNRRLVMHNDFLIVGPAGDPARIKGLASAADALRRLAEAKTTFVSRGDNSGTYQLEKKLWKEARLDPSGPWYLQAGQGMGATLVITSEKQAYSLTDRGTFLAFKKRVQLVPLVEKDRILLNIYSVLEPDPAKFPRVNAAGGRAFADFMVSKEAQEVIRTFGVDRFGEPLFFPDAGKREDALRE
ncbi:MAG: extracellular solute-binding protein [candidate division NC10 bacterium]|nr:extracellular solute-binding protein [candidate division NC10 bacterium]MBI4841415.1 extracellular solute-binding protein [candidate division NC10 bacterium]